MRATDHQLAGNYSKVNLSIFELYIQIGKARIVGISKVSPNTIPDFPAQSKGKIEVGGFWQKIFKIFPEYLVYSKYILFSL